MNILTQVIGNINNSEWQDKLRNLKIESIYLDQWTAQKSRFLATSDRGYEYPISLPRHTHIHDGDILSFNPQTNSILVLRLILNSVLIIDLSRLKQKPTKEIMRRCVELGHAIGNQHWPAVVKGTNIYVPLTVDKQVMLSVMKTHRFEDIEYRFEKGEEIIPYMAPHEIRRLFGGTCNPNHHYDPT